MIPFIAVNYSSDGRGFGNATDLEGMTSDDDRIHRWGVWRPAHFKNLRIIHYTGENLESSPESALIRKGLLVPG